MQKHFLRTVVALLMCACSNEHSVPEKHEAINKAENVVKPENKQRYVAPAYAGSPWIESDGTSHCPDDMMDVHGLFCPKLEEVCLQYVTPEGNNTSPPPDNRTGRCGTWKFPTKCLSSELIEMHFCIDTYEYPNKKGELPHDWMSWNNAKASCEAEGKRLCTKDEWTFACEGPNWQPIAYGDGYHRDRTSCNTDVPIPKDLTVAKSLDSKEGQRLHGLIVPSGEKEKCVSPFGVHDQIGNLDEYIDNAGNPHHYMGPGDRGPFISGLVGGYFFGVRNNCRAMTDGHAEFFNWYETSSRCCESAKQ